MKELLSVSAMRESDAATIANGIPGEELMRRAGEGIFHSLSAWREPVAIVCGSGNNAGDGYVLAVLLHQASVRCELMLEKDVFSTDGRLWFDRCASLGIPVRWWREIDSLSGYATVVDCLFGTGFHGAVAGEARRMIGLINRSGAFVLSVDINSGLNGDSGLAETAVQSDLTVSIGSYQPGHFLNQAKDLMKQRINCPIGIKPVKRPCYLLEAEDLLPLFPFRPNFTNKGTWGSVGLAGGSLPYSGAIRLASMAACAGRSGAGIVRVAAPRSLCPVLAPSILESTLFPLSDRDGSLLFKQDEFDAMLKGLRAVAFGMGVGNTAETQKAVQYFLSGYSGILILDADGLNALSVIGPEWLDHAPGRVILTPHPGEFSRLTGKTTAEVLSDPIGLAERFASRHGVILLLKGTATVITDGKETFLSDRGCAGMGTGGSGDVLSGILASVCASGSAVRSDEDASASPFDPLLLRTAAAAWLNGRAGELAQERFGDISMLAGDTAAALPDVFREIRNSVSSEKE